MNTLRITLNTHSTRETRDLGVAKPRYVNVEDYKFSGRMMIVLEDQTDGTTDTYTSFTEIDSNKYSLLKGKALMIINYMLIRVREGRLYKMSDEEVGQNILAICKMTKMCNHGCKGTEFCDNLSWLVMGRYDFKDIGRYLPEYRYCVLPLSVRSDLALDDIFYDISNPKLVQTILSPRQYKKYKRIQKEVVESKKPKHAIILSLMRKTYYWNHRDAVCTAIREWREKNGC